MSAPSLCSTCGQIWLNCDCEIGRPISSLYDEKPSTLEEELLWALDDVRFGRVEEEEMVL